ncbi:MAG: DUF2202 domain-containing protein [Caldilinea sp.]
MNTKRAMIVFFAAMALLIFSVSAVAAQGRIQPTDNCTNSSDSRCTVQPVTPSQQGRLDSQQVGREGRQGHGRNVQGNRRSEQRGQGMSGGNWEAMLPPVTETDLTPEMIEVMTAGILDEYHARAVYEAVIDEFGAVRPFTNIMRAEEQHAAAWAFIFERYGLEVPIAPEEFAIPEFASIADVCAAAAAAEVANFDLYDAMAETFEDYPDILQVITSLRNASEFNHLPAFENCTVAAQ